MGTLGPNEFEEKSLNKFTGHLPFILAGSWFSSWNIEIIAELKVPGDPYYDPNSSIHDFDPDCGDGPCPEHSEKYVYLKPKSEEDLEPYAYYAFVDTNPDTDKPPKRGGLTDQQQVKLHKRRIALLHRLEVILNKELYRHGEFYVSETEVSDASFEVVIYAVIDVLGLLILAECDNNTENAVKKASDMLRHQVCGNLLYNSPNPFDHTADLR